MTPRQPIEVLLVEDNAGDVELMMMALRDVKARNNISVAADGQVAMEFLRREGIHADAPRPDLILLDLNLPRMDGREVLAAIKADPALREIPVVVLTSSSAQQDIVESYKLQANSYVTKPGDLEPFFSVVKAIEQFWLEVVKLPK